MVELVYTREGDLPSPVSMEFPDATGAESLIVVDLGGGLYRLDESPLGSEFAGWNDVVRCVPGQDGHLVCVELVRSSGLHRNRFIPATAYLSCPNWELLKQRIMAAGGNWEQVWGGILILHYPPELAAELELLLEVG